MKRTYTSGHAKRVQKSKREKKSTINVPPLTTFFRNIERSWSGSGTTSAETEELTPQDPDSSTITTEKEPPQDVESNVAEDIDILGAMSSGTEILTYQDPDASRPSTSTTEKESSQDIENNVE